MEWTVSTVEQGLRLDKFLADPERLGSRRRASVALDRGKVFVNAVEAAKDAAATRLTAGDLVRVWMDRPGSARARGRGPSRSRDLRIIYEDDVLIVLDKPAGLLAVPLERRGGAPSIYDQVMEHLRPHGKRRPLVVHRIDRDTSGIVVVKPTPFFSAASTSPTVRVLPRSTPCWSAKASRTTDSSAALMRRSASRVAVLRSSVHRPARSTRVMRAYATSGGMVLAAQLEPLRRRASTSFQ